MNVLDDFNNLWHNHDLLNNLLENVWDFNDLFKGSCNWNKNAIGDGFNLNLSFNVISGISFDDKFLLRDNLISVGDDFFNLFISVLNGDNLFFNDLNFFDFSVEDWHLDNPVSKYFDNIDHFN